ncbi:MAG TPA: undecaprenyldiphospho-muramoylpentapeptide beta-N-acetylglucosaminyltransferase [Bryobacteraceae bacterium]|nr:undecaprenyldiphospho-muramoylpentapeptide beta-N-acetylglucosaminyltransferase [Bryobacteraceae bacterium]
MADRTFIMAGGGSGGHVIPLVAVACELRHRRNSCTFFGTRTGFEARLVPAAGFPIEYIEIGGLNRVGAMKALRSLAQLPRSVLRVLHHFDQQRPDAIFSLGGYVAGPVVIAGWWARVPVVIMEPNAIPGLTNRLMGRTAEKVLLNFPDTERFFRRDRCEMIGLPVRHDFFDLPPKSREEKLTVLITGGSQGSRTLNQAVRGSWKRFREADVPVRLLHQTGRTSYEEIAREFAESGLEGEVSAFIDDMPVAFAQADIVVCRAGAGATAELAAARKPSILVPLPTAADNHQFHNANAFATAGAARLVLDAEMNGERLFDEIRELNAKRDILEDMGQRAAGFAHPDAAQRAAEIVERVSYGAKS